MIKGNGFVILPVYFIKKNQIKENQVTITGDLLKHLRDSLRIKKGEKIFCVDEDGGKYTLVTTHTGKDLFVGEIIGRVVKKISPPVHIHLAQAIPKGAKLDFIIQKTTELGVNTITPVASEHCVVRIEKERVEERLKRWKKIALEAAQQSSRMDIPDIALPITFHDFISSFKKGDLNLLLYEGEKRVGIKKVLRGVQEAKGVVKSVVILIGPEGGFSDKEVEMAVAGGFTAVSLGEFILRTETAPIVAISIIQYELGYMG
ncbi:MAG: 16S rRNA (uracil(1498)-N(3))-methyltransferase [Nitrospirae bacterium]|nr:16S rRNA (uracil(1498)-N(3))-methyltransferase [Nitrospirota bacterium]